MSHGKIHHVFQYPLTHLIRIIISGIKTTTWYALLGQKLGMVLKIILINPTKLIKIKNIAGITLHFLFSIAVINLKQNFCSKIVDLFMSLRTQIPEFQRTIIIPDILPNSFLLNFDVHLGLIFPLRSSFNKFQRTSHLLSRLAQLF